MAVRGGSVLQAYIFKGGQFVGTDVFVENEIVVGRDPSVADLILESTSVSREHARIIIHERGLTVEDMGSTNGVLLNGVEVKRAEVTRLDELTIGEFTVKLKLTAKAGGRAPGPIPDDDAQTVVAGRPVTQRAPAFPGQPAALPNDLAARAEEHRAAQEQAAREQAAREQAAAKAAEEQRALERALQEEQARSQSAAQAEAKEAAKAKAREEKEAAKREKEEAKRRKHEQATRVTAPSALQAPTLMDASPALMAADATLQERAPLPDAVLDDDDDDDDDDDEDVQAPFSLTEQLIEDDARVAVQGAGSVLEVLTFHGEQVAGVALLRPGQKLYVGRKVGLLKRRLARDLPPRYRLVKVKRDGSCDVELRDGTVGTLRRGREKIALEGQTTRNRKGVQIASLKPGDILHLEASPNTYHLRYVQPPEKQKHEVDVEKWPAKLRPFAPFLSRVLPERMLAYSMGGSFGTHVVVFVLLTIFGSYSAKPAVVAADEFVEVKLESNLELEEKPPEPEPEPQPEPEKVAKSEKAPPKMEAAPSKKAPRAGGTSKAAPGVLGLLSKRGSSAAPGPASAVAALSNLSVAKAPGTKGGFRSSTLIGKMPTSSLSVGGGGGGLSTTGGAALLRGGEGGAGRLAGGTGTRQVGGMVVKSPKTAIQPRGQGTLDRDEIQKVINRNVGQIQRCYERELLKTPGLSGTITVEWTVATNGSVKSARQSFSSLDSSAVANCILGAIKGWKFPQPKGGEVVVTYPFKLRSATF